MTLQQMLDDARAKYHQLMTGAMVVEIAVDGNTFTTRFQRADADKLLAYISRLETAIAGNGRRRIGAIGIMFN